MSKKPNAIVFPATRNCVHEAKALVNSLAISNPDIPVYIMTSHISERQVRIEDFEHIKNHNVKSIIVEPPCDTEFRQIRTSRFRLAAELKDEYEVVCLLDADMVVIRDISKIFSMAKSGTILVTSNNTLLTYRHKDFVRMKVESPGEDHCKVHTTFTTVPFFINPTIHYDFLMDIWGTPTGNDLEAINLIAIKRGLMKNIYLLNSFEFNNIHHTMLKPETFAKMTDDGMYNHQGQ